MLGIDSFDTHARWQACLGAGQVGGLFLRRAVK